jgi:hypothetical protein
MTLTTLIRTIVDDESDRLRDLYLIKNDTPNRYTSTPPAEFEPAIPVSERPQAYT